MSKMKIYNLINLISIFAGFVFCLILIKGFGKNENQQEQYAINSGLDSSASIDDMLNMLSEPSHSPDTLFYPASDSMAISNDTLGSFTIYDANGNSLKARSVAGMFWTVESSKPIRIRLKDGYLESMGNSITWGFEYGFSQLAIMVFPDSSESKEDTLIYPKAALEQFDFCIAERDAIDFYRKQGFKVVAEWSNTRQCSVMVQWSKTDGDSIISYSVSNPDNYSQGIKQIKP